jgi:hypothetical protein
VSALRYRASLRRKMQAIHFNVHGPDKNKKAFDRQRRLFDKLYEADPHLLFVVPIDRRDLSQGRVIYARCHIDQRRNIRMHAGVGDDHAGEGMADQNCRTALRRLPALG